MGRRVGSKNKLKVDAILADVPDLQKTLDLAKVGMLQSMTKMIECMNGVGPFGGATLELRYKAAKEINAICLDIFRAEVQMLRDQAIAAGSSDEDLDSDKEQEGEEDSVTNQSTQIHGFIAGFPLQ
jgi:hypothetical protein